MQKLTITEIRALSMVQSANEWRDRIYINVHGNGGNFAGERNTKVWIHDGVLTVESGKGTTSREFDANLKALRAALEG
jgi:hypothetical protein